MIDLLDDRFGPEEKDTLRLLIAHDQRAWLRSLGLKRLPVTNAEWAQAAAKLRAWHGPAAAAVCLGLMFAGTPSAAATENRTSTVNTVSEVIVRPTLATQIDALLVGRPTLRQRSRGPDVVYLEGRLADLGFNIGRADGIYDGKLRRSVRAFQMANELEVDGVVGGSTWARLASPKGLGLRPPAVPLVELPRYAPGAPQTVALFQEAARHIGVPQDWASSGAIRNLLLRESDGWVGRPIYTYGDRYSDRDRWGEIHAELRTGQITAVSSATGLGQLLLSNVDEYYPSGRAGIGIALEEAVGMLAYIEDRYGSPQRAWSHYNRLHEGY